MEGMSTYGNEYGQIQRETGRASGACKKKKNVLEYQEISDFFKDQSLEVEQMEKVLDFLEASGVDVLRISGNVKS